MAAVDDAAANAFEMGEHAERLRCLSLVKHWRDGLKGTEYLFRSINILFDQIKAGGDPADENEGRKAINLAKAIRKATNGQWEPTVQQVFTILRSLEMDAA
jgi:hypothetical protein